MLDFELTPFVIQCSEVMHAPRSMQHASSTCAGGGGGAGGGSSSQ
jgi:hypothetical protein